MNEQLIAFREWYNAQWLGDQEHGQYIPHNGDPKYTEYLDGHTLALGAWMACLQENGTAPDMATIHKQECADVDRLIEKLGLKATDCRSEGGRLLVAKVANILRDQMAPGGGG